MSARCNTTATRQSCYKRNTITIAMSLTLANSALAAATSEPVQLPASTVTARMEQEDPKEVPISLSVISGEQLRTQRLRHAGKRTAQYVRGQRQFVRGAE